MIICELPAERPGSAVRAVFFGSCRVHNPIIALVLEGSAGILSYLIPYSHTLAGAIQLLELAQDRVRLPGELERLVLGREAAGADAIRMRLNRDLLRKVDVIAIEVCTDGQLMLGNTRLHLPYVRAMLEPVAGQPISRWLHQLNTKGSATAPVIAGAIDALAGADMLAPYLEDLVRNARMVRFSEADMESQLIVLKRCLHRMRGSPRILLVSHLVDPNDPSPVMERRRKLTQTLYRVAGRQGAQLLDPSDLFARLPRASIFDKGGRDVDEYVPSLLPEVGRVLAAAVIRAGQQPVGATNRIFAADKKRVSAWSGRPPKVLETAIRDASRARLDDFGQEESGLGAYYVHMLGRENLFTERGMRAFYFLTRHYRGGKRIMHVGASIGELPAALACHGYEVAAYAPGEARTRAAQSVQSRLEEDGIIPERKLIVTGSPIPAGGADLLVAIDAVWASKEPAREALLVLIDSYDAALIETQNFGCRRDKKGAAGAAILVGRKGLFPQRPLGRPQPRLCQPHAFCHLGAACSEATGPRTRAKPCHARRVPAPLKRSTRVIPPRRGRIVAVPRLDPALGAVVEAFVLPERRVGLQAVD